MTNTKNPDGSVAGPQGETHKTRMAPLAGSPPGQEQDSHGNVIALPRRTKDDQEKSKS